MVRHGQASYMSEDYDRLSPLGEEQAENSASSGCGMESGSTRAFTDPRKRHSRTAEIAAEW